MNCFVVAVLKEQRIVPEEQRIVKEEQKIVPEEQIIDNSNIELGSKLYPLCYDNIWKIPMVQLTFHLNIGKSIR